MTIFAHDKLRRSGQSLIELILAIALGVIFIGIAAMVIAPILKINTETNEAKVGGALARELGENVRLWVESDWHNLDGVVRGEQNYFHLSTSTEVVVLIPDFEEVMVGTTTYRRYFYVNNICRVPSVVPNAVDLSGDCAESQNLIDPSVIKVTVGYSWAPEYATKTFSAVLSRFKNRITIQTDWSFGSGFEGPTSSTNRFSTSSNIDTTSTPGVFRIQGI